MQPGQEANPLAISFEGAVIHGRVVFAAPLGDNVSRYRHPNDTKIYTITSSSRNVTA